MSAEGDVHFRVCGECRTLLERRDRRVAEQRDKPVITVFYEVLCSYLLHFFIVR